MNEKFNRISPIIFKAIDIMKICFEGVNVNINLISTEMYRLPPTEFAPAGKLGVDIEIEGIKVFLGCESVAEQIVGNPIGIYIAREFVYDVIKDKVNYNV